jgi:cyclopropane fatty-acyl-phospholipid synthase-like methyltransferase
VVGCGKGYDAAPFADAGFTVTGFDSFRRALEKAKGVAAANVAMGLIQDDILALPPRFASAFDSVLEYVMYCPIGPEQRPLFATAVASILRSGGVIRALLFPPGERDGGPPFEISTPATRELFGRHLALVSREIREDSVRPRKGWE